MAGALGRGSGDGNGSTLKTVHMLEFEKGSEVALEDLERWLVEFHRVVDHVSGGHGLPFKTLIVHLRACWTNTLPGDAGRAGENIRLDQETAAYRSMEAATNYEGCFNMLVNTLRKY